MQECRNVGSEGMQECKNVAMQECRNVEIQEYRVKLRYGEIGFDLATSLRSDWFQS